MIPVSLLGTASGVPDRCITSEDLVALAGLEWSAEEVTRRTGIRTRYWIGDSPMAPMAARTVRLALELAGLRPEAIARLIFVNSTGGDVHLGAASLPFALDVLMRTRPVRRGQRVLMAGVGAGAAYGAILYEV